MKLKNICLLCVLIILQSKVSFQDCPGYLEEPTQDFANVSTCVFEFAQGHYCDSCCPNNGVCCDNGTCMAFDQYCRYPESCCSQPLCGERCCSSKYGTPCGDFCAPKANLVCCDSSNGKTCPVGNTCCGNGNACCTNDAVCCSGRCCGKGQVCDTIGACCSSSKICNGICCRSDETCSFGNCCLLGYTGCGSTCCSPNQTCTLEHCCSKGSYWCNSANRCCSAGLTCIDGTCCNPSRICGNSCCAPGQICTEGTCKNCPHERICGNKCCREGEHCENGYCQLICPIHCGHGCCKSTETCRNGKCFYCSEKCGDMCCIRNETCSQNHCCPLESYYCQQAHSCCKNHDEYCYEDGCCNDETVCGSTCCKHGQKCIEQNCCSSERTCGMKCCNTYEVCVNGDKCCPRENMCGQQCCRDSEKCCNNVCCPKGHKCCYGEICCKECDMFCKHCHALSPFCDRCICPEHNEEIVEQIPSHVIQPSSYSCYSNAVGSDACSTFACLNTISSCGEEGYLGMMNQIYCTNVLKFKRDFDDLGEKFLTCAASCLSQAHLAAYNNGVIPCCSSLNAWGTAVPQKSCYKKCNFCDMYLLNTYGFSELFNNTAFSGFELYYEYCNTGVPMI